MEDGDGRGIEWRDNYPYPVYKEPYTKESYSKLYPQAAASRYLPRRRRTGDAECEDDDCKGCHLELGPVLMSEREYMSMTNAEAAVLRRWRKAAAGDGQALNEMSDRIIGKPKQQIDQTNVTIDIHAVLGDIMRAEVEALQTAPKAITHDSTGGAVLDVSVVEYDYLEGL